ncbi:HNH endonuclease [Acinetobacter baumannii]|uniref:HNH endonuclease n=1 Tax=Acinetobacter baumannii TaxID=470 RepID=UPI003B7C4DE9
MGEAKNRGSLEQRINEPNFTCIICRKIKPHSDRSDEHVIPDSLNGYYHIFSLCSICNKKLGSKVDNPLVDFKIMEFYRFENGIKGKNGDLPNPLSGLYSIKDNPGVKVRNEIINDKIVPRFLPTTNIVRNEDGTIRSVHISTDARDHHLVDGMMDKILARNNIDRENGIAFKSGIQVIENPELSSRWEINFHDYKIGLLKIAYEFAVDSIEEYFNDPLAIKISKILETNNYKMLDELEIRDGFNSEMFEAYSPIINIDRKRHILILSSYNKKMYCMIKLDNILTGYVRLSDKEYLDLNDSIIGINDLELKNFSKKTIFEAMRENLKELYIKFQYFIPRTKNLQAAQLEIKNPKFELVQTNGLTQLFNKDGGDFQYQLFDLLNLSVTNQQVKNEAFFVEFKFPENLEVYVKSNLTGNLFQVIGCEYQQIFSKI